MFTELYSYVIAHACIPQLTLGTHNEIPMPLSHQNKAVTLWRNQCIYYNVSILARFNFQRM